MIDAFLDLVRDIEVVIADVDRNLASSSADTVPGENGFVHALEFLNCETACPRQGMRRNVDFRVHGSRLGGLDDSDGIFWIVDDLAVNPQAELCWQTQELRIWLCQYWLDREVCQMHVAEYLCLNAASGCVRRLVECMLTNIDYSTVSRGDIYMEVRFQRGLYALPVCRSLNSTLVFTIVYGKPHVD